MIAVATGLPFFDFMNGNYCLAGTDYRIWLPDRYPLTCQEFAVI
jgi:hypothetical protein